MTYEASTAGNVSGRMGDSGRAALESLERVDKPSEWQRGQLRALRLTAASSDDQRRVAAVAQRWDDADRKASKRRRDKQQMDSLGLGE